MYPSKLDSVYIIRPWFQTLTKAFGMVLSLTNHKRGVYSSRMRSWTLCLTRELLEGSHIQVLNMKQSLLQFELNVPSHMHSTEKAQVINVAKCSQVLESGSGGKRSIYVVAGASENYFVQINHIHGHYILPFAWGRLFLMVGGSRQVYA